MRDVIEIAAKEEIKAATGSKKSQKKLTKKETEKLVEKLTVEMHEAAKALEFERAAYLRDKINQIKLTKKNDG